MWSRNAIQLFYGIPGIALYLLAFNCLYSIRKSINRSFLVSYVMMALAVCSVMQKKVINFAIHLEHCNVAQCLDVSQIGE